MKMMNAVTVMDENDQEIKSPMKRVGSTRKILIFNNIRQQLNEQLRCLDTRVESQVSLIQELQDFFRRRGELELDYSKSLDKFARSLLLRHKEQKQKREQWPLYSTFACWQHLVSKTQSLSKDHAILSELYAVNIVASLQATIEDVQRIYKKCRGIGYEIHEEILRVLQELHATMKTYQRYESECKAAELKLITADTQRIKLQQTIPRDKLERSKKYRLTEKEVLKVVVELGRGVVQSIFEYYTKKMFILIMQRNTKYTDARLKALKAKNEYQLCLEASNTTIHKYFVEDLSDLIDCMDLGFGSMISRAILMHVSADQGRSRAILQQADGLSHLIHSIDSRADKQKFLEQHHAAFMIPKRLEFQGQPQIEHEHVEPDIQKSLYMEMEQRLQMLGQRLGNLRTESDEIWKTLETAEKKLLEHFNNKDYDTSELFNDSKHIPLKAPAFSVTAKSKADKQEIEDFYLSKIREYIKGTSRIARLDAKAEFLRNTLASDEPCHAAALIGKPIVTKRKRIGRINTSGQPKLFGGSLEEYLESTAEEVPLIMRSCIRVINLFGLHHQGIFRVSGSQVEIANFREVFERGEDPLADTNDASDINSVAGVLKLYLRELREPLFPIIYFDYFVSLAEVHTKDEFIAGIRKFLHGLPRPIVIVIRYLFAFLNHLSEYADENMMDAHNLAICFGPTLMPAPEDKDQVQYQNQVNELIKNMIVYHEELFSKDLVGLEYEKYISQEPYIDIDVGDSPTEVSTEEPDSEVCPSEDDSLSDSEVLEAMVQFDFNARSNRELSLRKGDNVVLRKQVSNDWWQGTLNGRDGLIPDKYISLKIKDEDREKTIIEEFTTTAEESPRSAKLCKETMLLAIGDAAVSTTAPPVACHTHTIVVQDDSDASCVDTSGSGSGGFGNGGIGAALHVAELGDDGCSIKSAFAYHDEPHSFESALEFQNNYEKFEGCLPARRQKPEPIYAEPTKVHHHQQQLHSQPHISKETDFLKLGEKNCSVGGSGGGSSSIVAVGIVGAGITGDESPQRLSQLKPKSKSITTICATATSIASATAAAPPANDRSSCEQSMVNNCNYSLESKALNEPNDDAVITNAERNFQQNRKLWEELASGSGAGGGSSGAGSNSGSGTATPSGVGPLQQQQQQRIFTRKHLAPDLVRDLPFSSKESLLKPIAKTAPPSVEVIFGEEMTAAERFALQTQSTLKKNERPNYSADAGSREQPPKQQQRGVETKVFQKCHVTTIPDTVDAQTKPLEESD